MLQNPQGVIRVHQLLAGNLNDHSAESKQNLTGNDENARIVERIKQFIGERERSIAAFAEKIGWRAGTLTDALRNERQVSAELIAAISNKYAVSPDWLLTGKEPPPSLAEFGKPITLIGDQRDSELVQTMRLALGLAERVTALERQNARLAEKLRLAGIAPEADTAQGTPKPPEPKKQQ